MSLSKNTPQNSSQSVDSTATTKPCKNLVVRIDQDSDDNLQALFDSVLNPSDSKRPLQVPFRMRKLPNSFFNPPANTRTATGTGTSAHSRTNSADSAYGAGSQSSVNQDTIVSHSTDSQKPSTISSQQNVTNRLTIYHSRAHSSPASLQQTYSIQTNNINENNPPPPENANYVADIFSPTVNGNNAINSESDRRSSGSKSTVVAFHAKTRSYDVISPIQLYNELGALPPGWEQARTNDGQIYYLNHLTKSTQWEDPRLQIKETQQRNFQQPPNQSDSAEVTSIDANLGPLPEGWEQALTESGDVYFINHVNRTTSWNDPRIPEYLQKPVKIAKPEMLWITSPELGKEVAVVKQKIEQNPINSTTAATINMDPFLSGDNHARQESSDSGLSLSSNTFSLNATDFISQIDESMDCISESGLNGIDCPEHLVSSLQLEDNICNEMFDDVHNILHSPNAKPDNLEWYKIN